MNLLDFLTAKIMENEKEQEDCKRRLEELSEEYRCLYGLLGDVSSFYLGTDRFTRNLTRAFVSHSGILIKRRCYSSDELADLLGRQVLVTNPKDGCIQVYSLEGEYLATATRKK